MTMVNLFFKLKPRHLSLEEIEDNLLAIAGYCEVHAMDEYIGEIGTGIKGADGFRVYVYISSVADIVETVEKGIGAELLLAW